jgi:NAD+ synthase
MSKKLKHLQTDPAGLCAQIETFIKDSVESLGREGAVLGLSGGLDSATAALLIVRSLGAEKVHLLYMPDRDSNPLHRRDAKRLT